MPTTCRRCGAAAIANARFCRRCGTPLEADAPGGGHQSAVPPGAAPGSSLSGEGVWTKGPTPKDARRAGSETVPADTAELDVLLRQSSAGSAEQDAARGGDAAAKKVWDPQADDEEELTVVSSPRSSSAVAWSPAEEVTAANSPPPEMSQNSATVIPGRTPAAQPASPSNARLMWLSVGAGGVLLLLCVLAAGSWFAFDYFRQPVTVGGAGEAPPIPVVDAKQLFDEKLGEAEAQLAAGELEKAIASLREANRLDPANTRAHWRLGELLMESGRRREAIEEYRAVTRNDPSDRPAWRVLASAHLAENAYYEAAESYRRLLALSDEAARDPNDLLAYADALRLAGRADEARTVYQELSSSPTEAANVARARLADLTAQVGLPAIVIPQTPPAGVTRPAGADEAGSEAGTAQAAAAAAPPAATPAPPPLVADASLTPGERFNRAVELWASNRAAAVAEFRTAANGGSADAYYYLGLSIAEGRDPGTLNRAELVAAMSYFQSARRGRFGAQAQRYEAQLGEEYDRRKNQ